jgi:hypothetical protein
MKSNCKIYIDNDYFESAEFSETLTAGGEIWITMPSAVTRTITDFRLEVISIVPSAGYEPARINCKVISKKVIQRF